jgi:CRP/FNR family cyclic AMP-dependent transcriptional regulator
MTKTGDGIAALRAHPFGQVLTEPQLERLFRCGTLVDAAEGELIFREGDVADRLFLIRKGRIALEQHVTAHAPTQMETLEAGDVLGFSWLFETAPWTLDARAVTAAELFALDGDCIRREMRDDPALGLAIATQLTYHLYRRLQRVRLQRLDVYRAEGAAP